MLEDVLSIFNQFPELNEKEIAYIKSRGIEPEKVKHLLRGENGNAVKCKITGYTKKSDIDFVNVQARYIEAEKKDRFKTLPGYKATGLFVDKIDATKDYLIVVEGMFDFLSLRQFDTNVVGLFNATSIEAFDLLAYIVKTKKIKKVIYVNDNDMAGVESGERFLRVIETGCLLDVAVLGEAKDINDIVASGIFDFGLFLQICLDRRDEAQKEKTQEIEEEKNEAFEKVKNITSVYKNGMTIEFPVSTLNETLGSIKGNELSVFIGSPNSGKTTFAFLMALHNLKKGHKVGFLSYEMPFGDIIDQYNLWRIPGGMQRFEKSRLSAEDEIQLREEKERIMKNPNFYTYDGSNIGIEELKTHIKKMLAVGVTCIFLDNLIKVRRTSSELSDNQKVIEELFQTCHNHNVAINLLHHTDKISTIKNLLSYKGTSDVQIKPDNMFYLQRPGLTAKEEEMNPYTRSEFIVLKSKQRYGESKVNRREIVYFRRGMYYTQGEFIQLQG